MTARPLATRWLLVGVVLVAFALLAVAGCGSNDKWAGTWAKVDDQNTQLKIDKKDDTTYNVHDPDGKNAFDAKLSGNTLTGQINMAAAGASKVMADVTMTLNGDKMTFKIVYKGNTLSWDLKKK